MVYDIISTDDQYCKVRMHVHDALHINETTIHKNVENEVMPNNVHNCKSYNRGARTMMYLFTKQSQ